MNRSFAFDYQLKRRLANQVMEATGIRPVRDLYPTGEVYLVSEEGELRVFKIGFSGDRRDVQHIFPEARALQILAKQDAYRAPFLHSYREIQIGEVCAAYITKEFLEGVSLDRIVDRIAVERSKGKEIVIPKERFDDLEAQVVAAHDAGVCRLDVLPANILLTPEGTLTLFEYSGVFFRDQIEGRVPGERMILGGPVQFERYRRNDLVGLENVRKQLVRIGFLQ